MQGCSRGDAPPCTNCPKVVLVAGLECSTAQLELPFMASGAVMTLWRTQRGSRSKSRAFLDCHIIARARCWPMNSGSTGLMRGAPSSRRVPSKARCARWNLCAPASRYVGGLCLKFPPIHLGLTGNSGLLARSGAPTFPGRYALLATMGKSIDPSAPAASGKQRPGSLRYNASAIADRQPQWLSERGGARIFS
jgi:hypothetical protein